VSIQQSSQGVRAALVRRSQGDRVRSGGRRSTATRAIIPRFAHLARLTDRYPAPSNTGPTAEPVRGARAIASLAPATRLQSMISGATGSRLPRALPSVVVARSSTPSRAATGTHRSARSPAQGRPIVGGHRIAVAVLDSRRCRGACQRRSSPGSRRRSLRSGFPARCTYWRCTYPSKAIAARAARTTRRTSAIARNAGGLRSRRRRRTRSSRRVTAPPRGRRSRFRTREAARDLRRASRAPAAAPRTPHRCWVRASRSARARRSP